jgi:gamma-glutamyltranspeptidase/glutathione hydrolase
MKLAMADVYTHVADPGYMTARTDELLDDGRLAHLASTIHPNMASATGPFLQATPCTVYLCAADDQGTMVSFIQSNYTGFGSGIVIPGYGIAMQNRGHGFVTAPGHPNQAAPGKRPFHTIIPGFVTGGATMAFGVMGGPMQAQGHVQMVARIFGYGQNPQAASDAPRWQVAQTGEILLEKGFDPRAADELERLGHAVKRDQPSGLFGGAQLILKHADAYCAASDHRKDGCALGF